MASMYCLLLGSLISILVSAFKKLETVNEHPKVWAAILNLIAVATESFITGDTTAAQTVTCFVTQFVASVGFFEVVAKPTGKAIKGE